jgi:hypothetical protein
VVAPLNIAGNGPLAGRLAQRIDGMEYKGRRLRAYVPLFT